MTDEVEGRRAQLPRDTEQVGREIVHRQAIERTGALSDAARIEQCHPPACGEEHTSNGFEVASPSTEAGMTNDEWSFSGDISGEMYVAIIDHHPHAREPSSACAWMCRMKCLLVLQFNDL